MPIPIRINPPRSGVSRVAVGVAVAAIMTGCGSPSAPTADSPASTPPTTTPAGTPTPATTRTATWSANRPVGTDGPVRVRVAAAGIDARIVDVDVTAKGILTSPKGKAGWYAGQGAVPPGERGTAIIVGHVTYNEPDVFYNLRKVEQGDQISVEYEGGRTVEFVVTDMAKFDQDDNIVDKVWASTNERLLRLVTCDGQRTSSGYTDNLIVYAERV